MRVIGLTGSIACGKSAISAWIRTQAGCEVIDGDLLARELTAPGGVALPLIRQEFGSSVFYSDGSLNRRQLGGLIFSEGTAREKLDQLMAPLLQELTRERIEQARENGITLCFLDFPLLFEKGYDAICDTVWCVYLPKEIQMQRLMARDQISSSEALQRINAVFSSEEKAARSQVVIDNSGALSYTLSTLPPLLEEERLRAQAPRRRRSNHLEENEAASLSRAVAPPLRESPGAIMERPVAARQRRSPQKARWSLPAWLIGLLTGFAFLCLACFTAQSLMQAYLTRQEEQHLAEERAIHANYPLEYRQMITSAAKEFNLNPAFVSAIIRNESSFQPRAESNVGARGLMQLMPDTAEWIAGKMKVNGYAFERMYDPESNIRFGCWYLQYLSTLFHGDPVCVSCAYHAGQGQVTAWLSDGRYSDDGVTLSLQRLSDGPTKTYAGRVIRAYGIYQALYFEDHPVDPDIADALYQ